MPKTERSNREKQARKERSKFLKLARGEEKMRQEMIFQMFPDLVDEFDVKSKDKISRDGVGRPTVMTKQVILKLHYAFNIGCTDREAAIYAGIGASTLARFAKEHPEFWEQKEEWKESPVLAARANVVTSIKSYKSIADSWEYLRRKRKEEFAELRKNELKVERALTLDEIESGAAGDILVEEEE